ncbi:MAG: LytTR family DNA-binding domain-containing protein [Bacteroidota bacterium]
MKLNALIIDDEPLAHRVILEYAQEIPFLEIIGQCYLATEALVFLKEQAVDLLFLDIQMPKLKGFDFLRTLQHYPQVIVTSAYAEYAVESYEFEICDYLLKPFRFERFAIAVNKAYDLSKQKQEIPEQILLKSDKKLIPILIADIFYLESYGNYVKVWLEDGFHLTATTLSGLEQRIAKDHFYRIHKSYIINSRQLAYVEGNIAVLKNNTQLPIGKTQRNSFKAFLS